MARRGNIPKREVLADPIYNSTVITKLINQVMLDGKRGVAQKCVYDALDMIKEKTGRDPMEVFTECMENIKPQLEVKAPCWWRDVPGSDRDSRRASPDAGDSLAGAVLSSERRKDHEGALERRNHGCSQWHGRNGKAP